MPDLFESWLPGIQQFVEDKIMVDTVKVYKESPGALNETTGQYTPTQTVRYQGKGMILPPGSMSDGDDHYICGVPVTVLNVERGDIVEAITSTYDGTLTGRTWEVVEPMSSVAIGYRYLQLVDRANPGE